MLVFEKNISVITIFQTVNTYSYQLKILLNYKYLREQSFAKICVSTV